MDQIDSVSRSRNMSRIRSKDTKPEVLLRSMLHRLGYRFRLHCKDLPGKPDIVFSSRRKIIFVHGCFWHLHPGCREGRLPGTRVDYWKPKLERNVQRDGLAVQALVHGGWEVLTVWDCELQKDAEGVLKQVEDFLLSRSEPDPSSSSENGLT